jgi:hypothetical protein
MLKRSLKLLAILALPTLALAFGMGAKKRNAAIRATLDDGQVLYGDARTSRLSLDSPLGTLKIPLEDVGEVVPVEGGQLGDADGHVRIWLRDGSELVGKWQDPEIAMAIRVGKEDVKIDLPAQELTRLQTQGGEVWPHGAVYRVRTVHGDDFLVDARESRFTLVNQLGSFSPALADCRSVRPVDDPEGDWRIELATGTVLIGALDGSQLTLAMTLGPETVTVPLASFDSMEQQTWSTAQQITQSSRRLGVLTGGGAGRKSKAAPAWSSWEDREDSAAVEAIEGQVHPAAAPVPEPADDTETSDGWFQRDNLQRAKKSAS